MKNTKLIFPALLVGASLLTSPLAFAGSTGTNFNVSLQIVSDCTIVARDINLGTHYSNETNNVNAGALLTVKCPNTVAYSVGLTPSSSLGTGDGILNGAAHSVQVPYKLYKTNTWALADLFGNNSTYVQTGTGNGSNQDIAVYAQVLGTYLDIAQDSYADVVTATLTY